MIKIDGSYGEGGGQIIRTALALSTITGKSFKAKNIRKGRKVSGLKAQHIECVNALESLCNAKSKYNIVGSNLLKFEPGDIDPPRTLTIDIGTAGSISLLLQSILLPCFSSEKKLKLIIKGGTSGKWQMPYDFLANVLIPQIKKFADNMSIKLEKRGYYPKGGGRVELKIYPLENKEFKKIDSVSQGKLMKIKGVSHASKKLESANVAERQAKSAKLLLSDTGVPVDIRTEYADTSSPGSGISLWAIFSEDEDDIDVNNPIILGADALGEKGKKSEKVGREAATKLKREIEKKAPIDSHTADNLIPFLAVAGGKIKVSEITQHTKTNIWVCEQFLDKKFDIDEEKRIISIKG